MMALEVIIALNNQIGREAARRQFRPYVPSSVDEVDEWKHLPFEFPSIGSHVPKGWEQVESWFVDKTGGGYEWEPAMTHRRFKEVVREYIVTNPLHGFAVVEEGPFQVVIAAFRPVGRK